MLNLLCAAEQETMLTGLNHAEVIKAVAGSNGVIANGLKRSYRGELCIFNTHFKIVNHTVFTHNKGVAEDGGPTELFHERRRKLREGVAENDRLRDAAQLVKKRFCPRQRVNFRNGILNLLQSESVLSEDIETPAHELIIIRLVPRRALQLRNSAGLRKRDPDFRNQNAFQIQTHNMHLVHRRPKRPPFLKFC